ncbi:alanine--tRNA ligase [Patescibacteria group bacterium]|nr:alanine--tRNA ligase [Patescibacteria group bacterium]
MTSNELRQKYLDFFKDRGHAIIPSASLIPENDPSLLFTNSGMSPLAPYLLGEKHPEGARLANSQKCFRAEDIDEVGDNRHNTFFEMLGNWSFGDYYKREQLNWWFEFLIDVLKIDPKRLYQTVYLGSDSIAKDEESIEILKEIYKKYGMDAQEGPETAGEGKYGPGVEIDFKKNRIFAYRDKNWWQRGDVVGELGGPDSETFYDTGKKHSRKYGEHCHLNCDCGRFIEIGNSVFMQYVRTETGWPRRLERGWQELKNKNVDFGGGLERIIMAAQGKNNIFETDLFANLINKIERLSGKKYADNMPAFEVIADHLKAASFIMGGDKGLPGQGIAPSNTDQGYIVRRLIRRAIRYGKQIGIESKPDETWTKEIAKIVAHDYADTYPELRRNVDFIIEELKKEETKFAHTLERGLKEFEKLEERRQVEPPFARGVRGDYSISGAAAFDLYQTYGFPIEMTKELAKEKGLEVDEAGFNEELKKHQELSRTASAGKFKGGLADASEETTKLHTTAHLLLAALRKVLGDHVVQKGSNITAERLRFDFSHPEKMTDKQKQEVEKLVNEAIEKNLPVTCEEMPLEEAKKRGAMGVFESRYGERVKVYFIKSAQGGRAFSAEICGGPHVENTNGLGHFKIIKEESSSAGVRRIKAVLVPSS